MKGRVAVEPSVNKMTAVERVRHVQNRHGNTFALAFRKQILKNFKVFPVLSEAVGRIEGRERT